MKVVLLLLLLQGVTRALTISPIVSQSALHYARHIPLAREVIAYLDNSPDPFHAVQSSIEILKQAGFQEVVKLDPTSGTLQPGGKYYYTCNKSTLVAFAIGKQYTPGAGAFKIIGGHTDSPNLKIKPRSKRISSPSNTLQVGAECYGGGLWHTWFDRDLGISGRVFVREPDGSIRQYLVKVDRPILRIPNLAIHLQTTEERKCFVVNNEDHLSPILATEVENSLNASPNNLPIQDGSQPSVQDGWTEHQEPLLLALLATQLNVDAANILDFELNMFDIQGAALGGVHSEFLLSARLDNLASCFLATKALAACVEDVAFLQQDTDVNMVVLYDHEEVGSGSAFGAAGPILRDAIKVISGALGAENEIQEAMKKSFVISSDQAHALHPNYLSKHEKSHQPQMNAGMVIKRNANQRYATNGATAVVMREIVRRASLPPLQEFIVRQDCGCGSTIGPLISASTGIRTIDVGCPQLSMHSIREQMGISDLTHGLKLFTSYFQHFRDVESSFTG